MSAKNIVTKNSATDDGLYGDSWKTELGDRTGQLQPTEGPHHSDSPQARTCGYIYVQAGGGVVELTIRPYDICLTVHH
jgi:hypothetical protein